MEHDGDTSFALFQWSSCGLPSHSNYLNSNSIQANRWVTTHVLPPPFFDGQIRILTTANKKMCNKVHRGAEQQKRPYTKKVLNQSTNSNTDIEVWSETSLPKSIKEHTNSFSKAWIICFTLTNTIRFFSVQTVPNKNKGQPSTPS